MYIILAASGKGCFMSCKNKKALLPGTLLCFVPGEILLTEPKRANQLSERNYCTRMDHSFVDYTQLIPYPNTHFEKFEIIENKTNVYPAHLINPFAVGQFVNHVPPNKRANVILVDFDIPFTFYPHSYWRYIPYSCELTLNESCIKGMAYISKEPIEDGDELYADYYEEGRTQEGCLYLDWMVDALPKLEYLNKKERNYLPSRIARFIDSQYSAETKQQSAFRMIAKETKHDLDMDKIESIAGKMKLLIEGEQKKVSSSSNYKLDAH